MQENQRMSFVVNFPELKNIECDALLNEVIEYNMNYCKSDFTNYFSSLYFVSPCYFLDPNDCDDVVNIPTLLIHLNLSGNININGIADHVITESCPHNSPIDILMMFGKYTIVQFIHQYFARLEDCDKAERIKKFPITKQKDLETMLAVVKQIAEANRIQSLDAWISWVTDKFEKHCNSPERTLETFSRAFPKAYPYFKDAFEKQVAAIRNDEESLKKFFTAAKAFLQSSEDAANFAEEAVVPVEKPKKTSKTSASKRAQAEKKSRIAVIFGKFDPFHEGHVNLTNRILEQKKADRIVFAVTDQGEASYYDRCEMLSKFIANHNAGKNKDYVINMVDFHAHGVKNFDPLNLMKCIEGIFGKDHKYYVVQTMPDLFDKNELVDSMWLKAKFNKKLWEQYPVIFVPPHEKFISNDNVQVRCNKYYVKHWLDAQLPPVKRKLMENMLDPEEYEENICPGLNNLSADTISSSNIRELLGHHCNVSEEVPKEVYEYIIGNHLYF